MMSMDALLQSICCLNTHTYCSGVRSLLHVSCVAAKVQMQAAVSMLPMHSQRGHIPVTYEKHSAV